MIKMCIKVCIKIQCRKKKKFFALLEQNLFYLFHIFTHILVYDMKKKKLQKKKYFIYLNLLEDKYLCSNSWKY